MAQFNLQKLRDIADEGIARHGLRGYARKLGLDVSTMRSLRDGRDMQISKALEIVAALGLTLEFRQTVAADTNKGTGDVQQGVDAATSAGTPLDISIAYHCNAPQTDPAHISFDRGWLARQGWQVQCLRWVIAPKAASAICVPPGALCLMDCAEAWPDAHAVWAYLEGGALNIAYLSRPAPGALLISGSDPATPARYITGPALDAVTPLGRVVWADSVLPGQPHEPPKAGRAV
jgi:hypothetical protein